MNLITRVVKIGLVSIMLFLVVSPSFSKATAGHNLTAKRVAPSRTLPHGKATNADASRKKDISVREMRRDKQSLLADAKPHLENRSSKASKAARLRLEQNRLEAKRRADAERLAYVRVTRDEELRNEVQSLIAKDDLAGEDPEVRRVAVAALGNHAGTVVVMNPQTGRVYSMVNQQWALREGFKPCSTIKLVTGLAGLNENVIDLNDTTKISDNNQVSLTRALAYSKNEYFQEVGGQVGFDKMVSYARRLGLGEKTGINVHNESQGSVPGSDSRNALLRMWSHGDNFQVTPIQLATLVSAMANGGRLLTPNIARTKKEESNFKTRVRRQVKMDTTAWQQMIPGMVGAVSYGSGKRAYDPRETVAGKTGTCIDQGVWVGLFTSYAPLVNPQLAVVVIARGADAQNHFPAAVAGRIYRDLNGRFGTPANLQIASSRKSPAALNATGTDVDEDQDDESTVVRKTWNEANNIGGISRKVDAQPLARTSSGATDNKVKPVLMQIPTRNSDPLRPIGTSTGKPLNTPETETRPRRVFGER